MQLSAGEWASLGMKAARGGGYSWGLAEEFGASLAVLAQWGINGAGPALALCAAQAVLGLPQMAEINGGVWGQSAAPLCPVATGALICDLGHSPQGLFGPHPLTLVAVAEPLMLLPFLDGLAAREGRAVQISTPKAALVFGGLFPLDANEITQFADHARDATLTLCAKPSRYGASVPRAPYLQTITPETYADLDRFALETTVPATAQSRETGAGAGLSDND
ncbi:DUF3726 domain-containing protein [Rhodobacterales bacterium HKCCD6035]|nr:DUF3726 domain-containing protein [Rhodobacterales bacterium HKCCD6035]